MTLPIWSIWPCLDQFLKTGSSLGHYTHENLNTKNWFPVHQFPSYLLYWLEIVNALMLSSGDLNLMSIIQETPQTQQFPKPNSTSLFTNHTKSVLLPVPSCQWMLTPSFQLLRAKTLWCPPRLLSFSLSCSTTSPLANPVDSIFKTHPSPDCLSLPPVLPPCYRSLSSLV